MICVSATRTMGRTAVRFHLQSASLWTPLINSLFLAFSCFLGDLNGLAVYGILLSLWLRETAWAGIFQSNTLWRFHFPPLILHWQLSFSPPLKSHFQSLMAVMSLCSLDSYSKCHWHNGRQPLASFDHPCCVQEQLEPKHWGVWGVCSTATPRQISTTGNLKFTFK